MGRHVADNDDAESAADLPDESAEAEELTGLPLAPPDANEVTSIDPADEDEVNPS